MLANVIVPQLGESVVEATVGAWRKSEGDAVEVGEVVVELETDKVDLEVGATQGGVLHRIEHKEGDVVKIGDLLGVIEVAPEKGAVLEAKPRPVSSAAPQSLPKPTAGSRETSAESVQEVPPASPAPRATPSARRLAFEKGMDLLQIHPALPGAAITASDVEARGAGGQAKAPAIRSAEPPAAAPLSPQSSARSEERVRMSRRRLTIATRLVAALRSTAMVTTFNDVDMTAVMEMRRRHKESFQRRFGVGLGIASFFVKASIAALRAFPRLNAEIQGEEFVFKHYYDIGVAVGAADGLVVPVLRDADRMSFGETEQAIKAFAHKAEAGTLTLEDLRGGTFTISNGGVFGSLLSTPILNPPQVGILGLHRIEERPVNVAGEVRIRPMMYVALSYDHRIVDGLEAVRFLRRIKELIENPASLFLEA